ncbi:MAG: hypothetical protein DRH56_10630 [Deltaproteobacteria bacterium]|nr:MAG: hypothetical protein DRH56_10630 [Deltaproteobacteria bacterium]
MIHPQDARERGIPDGGLIRVFNDRGECLLHARITGDTAPGVTVVEGLYWPEFTPRKPRDKPAHQPAPGRYGGILRIPLQPGGSGTDRKK